MKVNIQAVNFNVDRKLVDFINERLEKLEQYYDKIVGIDVSLRTENTSDKENKSVDILIKIPGDDLIVKKTAKTFEEADRKSTRLNSSHVKISYAVFCLNVRSTTYIYTLSLHDALPIFGRFYKRTFRKIRAVL